MNPIVLASTYAAFGFGPVLVGRFAITWVIALSVGLLRFADGTVAKTAANFGCVYPHFHRLSIYGTTATFELPVHADAKELARSV